MLGPWCAGIIGGIGVLGWEPGKVSQGSVQLVKENELFLVGNEPQIHQWQRVTFTTGAGSELLEGRTEVRTDS